MGSQAYTFGYDWGFFIDVLFYDEIVSCLEASAAELSIVEIK